MNFSNFFISRPIFATVLAIIVTLVGVMSMRILPIEQYPSVVPPTVSVQAQFPGADAETVAQTVAAPIAEAINGVEDMLYMTSNSADNGTMSLSVAFNIGTSGDINTINVNNRVQGALSQLPEAVQSQGVTVELRSDSILMFIALTSPSGDYDKIFMQNYATLNVLDELRQVPGVGNAEVNRARTAIRLPLEVALMMSTNSVIFTCVPIATALRFAWKTLHALSLGPPLTVSTHV